MENLIYYDTKGVEFSEDDMLITELPPIPDWFQESLKEAGGTYNDTPNIRVVSGLNPDLQEFIGGQWRLKYSFIEVFKDEIYIWHREGKKPVTLMPKEAEVLIKSNKKEGFIIPRTITRTLESGIPRYFVEIYKPASYFGTPEEWEKERFDKDENDEIFDLMGEFPYDGMYETWFCIEEPILDKDNKVVSTKFKELDELTLEFIKYKIEEIKNKTATQQHIEYLEENKIQAEKKIAEMKDNVKEIIKERIDRIVETPKSFVPNNYEK